jgi:hypothetical protein
MQLKLLRLVLIIAKASQQNYSALVIDLAYGYNFGAASSRIQLN